MQDATAVCVGHRVTDVEEPAEQLPHCQGPLTRVATRDVRLVEVRDGVLEVVPLDEPHGIKGPAVGVGAQAVDRDDPRMLEPAGDLGFSQEAGPAVRVVSVSVADLLQGHVAVQLLVTGDVNGPQAACPVEPQDAEPHAGGRGGAGRAGTLARGVLDRMLVRPGGAGEVGLQLGVGDLLQILAGRTERAECGQALSGVAAVPLEVLADQGLEEGVGLGVDGAALSKTRPSARDLSVTQAAKAATSVSRSMK